MDLDFSRQWPDGQALLANQYYFDELYAATLVSGISAAARALGRFDARVINSVVNGFGWTVQIAGWTVHMIEKHVVDRMVEGAVSGLTFMGARFGVPLLPKRKT